MRPVCIVGTGYVGMACMLGLAELGWVVHGYDIVRDRIDRLRRGIPPYREPGLDEILRKHAETGRVRFFDDLEDAARDAMVIVVAVGTPARDDGSADIAGLRAALQALSEVEFAVRPTVAIRSTVPPGTTDQFAALVEQRCDLVYAPEFLREGSAVHDFLHPDRIVVGCTAPDAGLAYARLLQGLERPLIFTSRRNAELIKSCSNAFLALKISFANEIAALCDSLGGESDDVLRGIGYDRRIGGEFLRPGIGFGGPCFEKDVRSIEYVASQRQLDLQLFSATLRVNDAQPRRVLQSLEREMGTLAAATIGVWGLAFKAGTDDVRDSLALRIVDSLARRGARTVVYDPYVHVARLPAASRLTTSALEAANADALLVLTEWPQFAAYDPTEYGPSIRRRIVVDGRNILDPERVTAAGLRYVGVGRESSPCPKRLTAVSAI
ncbi:MAG: UDP-glucose/GDP-mannose dehydrogenase family protein [Candidatus Eremiobacteraeota bacterium]|nr:UDP-glucose/GDP-mannose dehydrogenase family protein [Candidatus Eremiobacteraeota bacterium]